MEQTPTDAAGVPIIERTSAKVAALERRADYLERSLAKEGKSETAKQYERAELSAVRAGILALKFHRAEVDALDTPILALSELVDAVGAVAFEQPAEVRGVLARARKVLAEWRS